MASLTCPSYPPWTMRRLQVNETEEPRGPQWMDGAEPPPWGSTGPKRHAGHVRGVGGVTGAPGMLGVVTGAPGLNQAQWPCQMTSYPEVTAPPSHSQTTTGRPSTPQSPGPLGPAGLSAILPILQTGPPFLCPSLCLSFHRGTPSHLLKLRRVSTRGRCGSKCDW